MPIHHKRIRLRQFDYSTPGTYFVTVVVLNRECSLGAVDSGMVALSDFGQIAADSWRWLGANYSYVELDEFAIMPNHLHALLTVRDEKVKRMPLGKLIGAFKTLSTRDINLLRDLPGKKFWQDEFYEHIIRDDNDLKQTREYIRFNPLNWNGDSENPNRHE